MVYEYTGAKDKPSNEASVSDNGAHEVSVIDNGAHEVSVSDKAYFWGLEMSLMVLRLLATALLPFCASYTHWTPNVTYCHVHMAKTAGTSLNMELANQYERVCGHKGYSFDFFQSNARAEKNPYRDIQNLADSVSKEYNEFSRERVHADIMRERGYEDCDWISLEAKWTKWKEISRRVGPLELHVPCREPIDHLMSMCNMWNHQFDCQAANITKEVGRCLIHFYCPPPISVSKFLGVEVLRQKWVLR
jgi:hypothetical protein